MTFDPAKLGLTSTGGAYNSETIFAKNTNQLTFESDGSPAPARADITDVERQTISKTIRYRGGDNSQYPQISSGKLGMFANGIEFLHDYATKKLPGSSKLPPVELNFNRVYFKSNFDLTTDDAQIIDGVYNYNTGAFLSNSWNYPNVWGSKAYYSDTNFQGDYYRHTDGHSKILGFCYDGYPIYGPYGYVTGEDEKSGIKLVKSSYRAHLGDSHRRPGWKYTDTIETTLGDTILGPGAFVEDFVYSKKLSDLDEFNGRYCVTPDFPEGTYAYFLTFTDETLDNPAYPYIVGPSTKQHREFIEPIPQEAIISNDLWSIGTGNRITTLIERNVVNIPFPLYNREGVTVELISGELPPGLRIEGNSIVGTVYEVAYNRSFNIVIRAYYKSLFEDRTFEIAVTGPDDPEWVTARGLLPIGPNDTFYILDSEVVDFQLQAIDSDLPAGDELSYFIADGDGTLPPGITLTEDGRIYGVTEPLLSLDKRFEGGGYDTFPFSALPMDYAAVSDYYGTRDPDTITPSSNLIKLNRYYPFAVTVTDGDSFIRREFRIYVVGDDFLKADNTEMQSSTTMFKADATNVRNPTWITPRDLGYRRANNYTTLFLDIINNPTLEGAVTYSMEDLNDDGSKSELPPGLSLDKNTGELYGNIPYQTSVLQDYKFTVRATRRVSDLETLEIFGTFYEDTLLGNNSFKIYKTDLTGLEDGINDLFELVGQEVLIENNIYTVTSVDDRNNDYDIIFLNDTLAPSINLLVSRTSSVGQDHFFVQRLSETNKNLYQSRTLKFSENEEYVITDIIPYIEYNVIQTTPDQDAIYPANAPMSMTPNNNYYVGDFAIWPEEYGGNGRIFKCIEAHTMLPLVDEDNELILNDAGEVQIDFDATKWLEVAERLEQFSITDRLTSARQALNDAYGSEAYIRVINQNTWNIRIPSTSKSRILSNIASFFKGLDSTEFTINLVRDNEHKILLDRNLSRQFQGGTNIGIALFKNNAFSKNLIVSSEDPVNIPTSSKTFEIKILGDVDSNISWVTEPDLGTINANFDSTLKVIAQTTVPDTKMVYTLVDGKLPNGLELAYDGEIIGAARQFGTLEEPGLTTFENKAVTWDGNFPGDTTFDREYKFTVKAKDRFEYAAIEREFTLKVEDLDDTVYTNIYMKPMLPIDQRLEFQRFISNPDIFTPSKIYRARDEKFGVQENLEMLVYAGIEATDVDKFVSAAAKNHKRKKYILGDFKSAVAKDENGNDIYEVVYIDVVDPAEPKQTGEYNFNNPYDYHNSTTYTGKNKTRKSFKINTEKKITVDSIQYAGKDDVTKTGLGTDELPVYGRQLVKFVFVENETLLIQTREGGAVDINVDDNDFELVVRDTSNITVELQTSPAEPYRLRPTPDNTIKADSDAIKVSQSKDDLRYITNITNMRDNIKAIGKSERNYLPLWMRTAQEGLQELDYVSAIPVCYCIPGTSDDIIRNIKNNGFDPKIINYDIDRYIVRRTKDSNVEKYILFANYQFNV
jgi:hypothetical protein